MARLNRQLVSAELGGYHIISRVAGGDFLLKPEDKDHFLLLLRRFVAGYFIELHSFAIMSNHFHLLVTMSEEVSVQADENELAHRLWTVNTGEFCTKSDQQDEQKMALKYDMLDIAGKEKARERLSSISRFAQDLKQSFARYFNQKYRRLGCLWGSRFKGVIISHGNAQLACSAYIDLNPVRAGIVKKPEDYPWSSLGLVKNTPDIAKYLLTPVPLAAIEQEPWEWYKFFVYENAGLTPTTSAINSMSPMLVERPEKDLTQILDRQNTQTREQIQAIRYEQNREISTIDTLSSVNNTMTNVVNKLIMTSTATNITTGSAPINTSVKTPINSLVNEADSAIVLSARKKYQELQIDGRLLSRVRNLSEGIVVGTSKIVVLFQEKLRRSPRNPQGLWGVSPFFTTRIFHR